MAQEMGHECLDRRKADTDASTATIPTIWITHFSTVTMPEKNTEDLVEITPVYTPSF